MPITISQHYHNKISSDRLLLTIIEGKKWLVQIRTNNKIPQKILLCKYCRNVVDATLPINIQGNDWIDIIKFDTELKPTKHNWNHNFTNISKNPKGK